MRAAPVVRFADIEQAIDRALGAAGMRAAPGAGITLSEASTDRRLFSWGTDRVAHTIGGRLQSRHN